MPNDDIGTRAPFVIVGDKSFALSKHALRTHLNRSLDVATHTHTYIYSYRLTGARRMVECAFGMPLETKQSGGKILDHSDLRGEGECF